MKNKKWLWITLTTLLTLVVMIGVAGAGFQAGLTQNANFLNSNGITAHFSHENNFEQHHGSNPHTMQGFEQGGFNRHGARGFLAPIFGLFQLTLIGLVLWFGYKFIKNSGWKITRTVPVADEKKE